MIYEVEDIQFGVVYRLFPDMISSGPGSDNEYAIVRDINKHLCLLTTVLISKNGITDPMVFHEDALSISIFMNRASIEKDKKIIKLVKMLAV